MRRIRALLSAAELSSSRRARPASLHAIPQLRSKQDRTRVNITTNTYHEYHQSAQYRQALPLTSKSLHSKSMFSLEGRTIIITGGARGLGATFAQGVLEAGGNVLALDLQPKPDDREWASILKACSETDSVQASYRQIDVTTEDVVRDLLAEEGQKAVAAGKPIRGLVHCAGIQQLKDALSYPAADFNKVLAVNVTGSFTMAQQTAKLLIEQKMSGSLVLVASMSGFIANRGMISSAYNSSKAAVHQLTRSLAVEFGEHGIRVNSLSPGYVRTAMLQLVFDKDPQLEDTFMAGAMLGRLGTPQDLKAPVIYLLADGSSFMTGFDLRVDGGHCASA